MAKTEGVNKTQAVADYLNDHPKAMSPEIAEAMTKQGIEMTVAHAANIKSKLKRLRRAKKAKRAKAAEQPAVATADGQEKPSKPGETITLEQIRKVTQTVRAIGGFERLKEMLEIVREVGGLKKFKDLLEAMSVTGSDKIPF